MGDRATHRINRDALFDLNDYYAKLGILNVPYFSL